ncbi:MAG: SDR family oxidoreductase [Chloroflexota bacterium]
MQGALTGQVALVTGASRGIGRAVAVALAAEGAAVLLAARTRDALAAVVAEIGEMDGKATGIVADVADEAQVRALLAAARDQFGRLDMVVNSAGIGVFKPLRETTAAEWDVVMAVNARGAFLVCREAAPLLAAAGGGCIVNIASVVGVKGYANQGAYTASKHALMGLTKVLAQELKPQGTRVHVVCPGGVDTDLVARARPDLDRSDLMLPEEIAVIVLFLVQQRGRAIVDQINVRRASSAPWIE